MKKSKFMLGVLVVLSLLLVSMGDFSFFTSSAEEPAKVYGDILELDPVETSALWAEYGEVKTTGAKYGDSYFERASSPTAIFARFYGVPLNISGYKENGYFHLWVYVETSTGIDGQIELSSITADDHELSWNINELALEDGWNELYLPLSTGNAVGGEMDYTSVKFFRMYVNNAVTAGIDGLYFCHEVEAEEGFLCGDKTIIDNADSTDGWFGSDLEVKTDNPPEGTGYIANNGVDEAGNAVLVTIFDPIDLSKYGEDGYFHLYVYISDYSALAYGNIEISGSGTADAALYWEIREYARHSGWNELYLPLDEGIPQNGEINLSAVNYFRIYGGGVAFEQLGVDDLFACKEKVEEDPPISGEPETPESDPSLPPSSDADPSLPPSSKDKIYGKKSWIDKIESIDADSLGGWFGTSVKISTSNAPAGSQFIETNSFEDNGAAVLAKVFTPAFNFSKYKDEGYLHIWLYVEDVNDLTDGRIEISSSGTPDNAAYWQIKNYAKKSGWNELYLPISQAEGKSEKLDFGSINYMRIFTLGNVQIGVDDIYMCLEVEEAENAATGDNIVFFIGLLLLATFILIPAQLSKAKKQVKF